MKYNKINVNGIQIFYRECGDAEKPIMVLFHGFPSASHMFRDLMPKLEERFHLIAPDYPGFGQSESPSREEFKYTFDHLAEVMSDFRESTTFCVNSFNYLKYLVATSFVSGHDLFLLVSFYGFLSYQKSFMQHYQGKYIA